MSSNTPLFASIIAKVLKPLALILLRNGISYTYFAEIAKKAFIDAAQQELESNKQKSTISSISTITGLTRKDVSKLKKSTENYIESDKHSINRAARVISGWINNQDFQNTDGKPASLPLDGENSFSELVKQYSGDMTVKSIQDELLRINAIEIENQQASLIKHAYIPEQDNHQKLEILGTDVAGLLQTINHNLVNEAEQSFFQRKTTYQNIPVDELELLKKKLFTQAQAALEKLDQTLYPYNQPNTEKNITQVNLGIYYFEGNL